MMYFLKNVFVTLKDSFFSLNPGRHTILASPSPRFLQRYSIPCWVAQGVVPGQTQLWNILCHKSQLLLTRTLTANPRRTSLKQHSICRTLPGQCQSRVERSAQKCWRWDRKAIWKQVFPHIPHEPAIRRSDSPREKQMGEKVICWNLVIHPTGQCHTVRLPPHNISLLITLVCVRLGEVPGATEKTALVCWNI